MPWTTAAQHWIDWTCSAVQCGVNVRQEGCAIALETTRCEPWSLGGDVDPSGVASLDGCESTTPADGALMSAACEDQAHGACRVDLYASPFPPRVDSAAVAVLEVPFLAPSGSLVPPQALEYFDPLRGYLGSFVVLGDRIAITSYDGVFSTFGCAPGTASRIVWIDAVRLVLTETSTAPDCLTRVARDPAGDGFLGIAGTHTASIVRFDRDGIARRVVPLTLPDRDESRWATALMTSDPAHVIVVLSSRSAPGSAYVLALDPATLAIRETSRRIASQIRAGAPLTAGVFALSDRINSQLLIYEAVGLTELDHLAVVHQRRVDGHAGAVAWQPMGGRIVLAATGQSPGLWSIGRGDPPDLLPAVFYEKAAVPWATAVWPADPQRMIVGLTETTPELDAWVALFDPLTARYLPGAVRIGRGVVSEMQADTRGDVWALLPWSGQLVRVRSR